VLPVLGREVVKCQQHVVIFGQPFKNIEDIGILKHIWCVDKLNICVIKIISNLLDTYDNYTGKYKILLNFFNKVTF